MTPDCWLLARYDRETRRAAFGPWPRDWHRTRRDRGSNFERPIFQLLDDHPPAECEISPFDGCCEWSLSGLDLSESEAAA